MDVGCLAVPRFPLACERAARPQLRGRAVAVAHPGRAVLLTVSEEAERWGVAPGQTVSEGVGRCSDLEILDPRPGYYTEVAEEIITALELAAPGTEPVAEGLCHVDLRGLMGVHGSAAAMERALLACAPAALEPRLGIGPTRFTSLVAATDAHAGGVLVLAGSEAATFLAPRGVDSLPVDAETLRRLRLLGLETLGDVAALPVATLTAQFGGVGEVMHKLASGSDDSRVRPRAWKEHVEEILEPETPLSTVEPLLLGMEHLLARACHSAAFIGRACRQAVLVMCTEEGRRWERTVTFKEALSEPRRIAEMLRPPLRGAVLPGPITLLRLELRDLTAAAGSQVRLLGQQGERRVELDEGLRKLRAQYGFCPVAQIVDVEPWSRIPERRLALTYLAT